MLLAALVVMSLCVIDVFATLILLEKGSVELNPLMRILIETDVRLFFGFKYIATAIGLFLLLSFRKFRLYRTSFNSLHTLYGIIVVYSLLVLYQLTLLYLTAD